MEALIQLFNRDLDKLIVEIRNFNRQENLWKTRGNITNSAGNLCLHLIGNLNYFIGTIIGNTGYIRDRESEFKDKNVDQGALVKMILETKSAITLSLESFNLDQLKEKYPINVFGEEMTNEFFLIHLNSHLNYHLGQINYLRRFLES